MMGSTCGLLFTVLLVLYSEDCLGWECEAQEGSEFTINCTGPLTGDDRGIRMWWTANNLTSGQATRSVISECRNTGQRCVNYYSRNFTANITENLHTYKSQLTIHTVTPSQRLQKFQCVDWNATVLFSCYMNVLSSKQSSTKATAKSQREGGLNVMTETELEKKESAQQMPQGVSGDMQGLSAGDAVNSVGATRDVEQTIINNQFTVIVILATIIAGLFVFILLSKAKSVCREWPKYRTRRVTNRNTNSGYPCKSRLPEKVLSSRETFISSSEERSTDLDESNPDSIFVSEDDESISHLAQNEASALTDDNKPEGSHVQARDKKNCTRNADITASLVFDTYILHEKEGNMPSEIEV